jgi:hypothetical protein
MGGWNEIRWLTDDIFEIYKKSIESRDQEIFADVAYIPVGIAVRAIKKKDQYVYQEFLRFPGHLYWLATKVEAGEFRDFMVDRSWRHLKEMSDFYVEHEIKRKANSAEKITQYAEFTIPIFVAFQNLIKTAFDARDFESFSTFLDKFSQIYDDFDPQEEHINTEHFKLNLGWSTDDKQREDLKARLSIQEAKEAAVKDIFLKRQQVIFGLSAFIFDQVRNNPTNEGYRKFFDKVSNLLPRQLPELTSTYQTSRQFETEHFWDWDNWEMVPDGVVRSIDFHSKLDRLYAVKGLIILSGLTEDQVSSLVLPHSRDLAFQAENRAGNTNLYSLLNDISTHPDNWAFILPAAAIQKTSAFQALLLKAKEAQESEEEKFIESSGLDEEKLSEFKSKLFSTFDKAGTMRPLLKAMGVYTSQSAVPKEEKILSWGYNQIGEKAAFVKGWYVHYSGFGEEYGQGMASSEDQLIFQEIVSGLAEKNVTKENIVSEIKNVIDSQNIENPIILQTLDFQSVYSQIRQADIFLDHYNRDCPKNIATGMHGYLGVLKVGEKNIPIVQVFVRETALKNKIVVVDLDKFGVLNQYPPKEKSEDEKYVDGIFYLRVADLNVEDELRQKIISEKPAWLDEYADKDAYLRGKVLINVYQKFRFEIKNKKAGAYLSVGGPVPPDEDE